MKRLIALALVIGLTSSIGLTGCGEETKVSDKETISTPAGTTTTTTEKKIESSGSNPPANSEGSTAETPK